MPHRLWLRFPRSMLRIVALVAAGCGLAACTWLGPHYKRPDIPVPQTWRSGPDASGPWPSEDWWHGFNSPTLNDLMEQARAANDDIGAAVARIRQADAQARIQIGR